MLPLKHMKKIANEHCMSVLKKGRGSKPEPERRRPGFEQATF